MNESRFSGEQPSTEMTSKLSADDMQTTGTSTPGSFTQVAFNYFFYIPGIVIGALGLATNGIIVYALYASKQHKKQMLIFNQNLIDLFTCFWLFITYIVHLSDLYLVGALGYWLCMLITTDTIVVSGITASKINLMAVTVERYLKVVHSTWSKKRLRKWMRFAAMAVAWVGGAVYSLALTYATFVVVEGRGGCAALVIWPSQAAFTAYGIYAFASFFAIPLLIFAFCYERILAAIRRQAQVIASHNASQTQSKQIQTNVIVTMILVTLLFALTNTPLEIFYLLLSTWVIGQSIPVYCSCMLISFGYICANPFVYAIKFKPVKDVVLRLMPCKLFRVENTQT